MIWKIWVTSDIDKIVSLKELRNEITHEYLDSDLKKDVERILKYKQDIINLVKNVREYSEKN